MSTTSDGNEFRDLVASLLEAAGFRVSTEVLASHKKVDAMTLWERNELEGVEKIAIEAKNYTGTLPADQVTKFINDYTPLIQQHLIARAWLVSKSPLSAAGQAALSDYTHLKGFHFRELQDRLVNFSDYLRDQIDEWDRSQLARYYIQPFSEEDEDLRPYVDRWIASPRPRPLFVLGPYGRGKSTFAMKLSADLAREALLDYTKRKPILVRLGDIVDEQSIDGLLGKLLTSTYRVRNYHYSIFRRLNSSGAFVLIYDGFDEMRHGMTTPKYTAVLNELLKLNEGDARIIILGRETAFHSEEEFEAVMEGRATTSLGQTIRPARPHFVTVRMRDFSVPEAHDYVEKFLPLCVEQNYPDDRDGPWVAERISLLKSAKYAALLRRPVHAQMLCQIASRPDFKEENSNVARLYDTFVHHLIERETAKRGRDPSFSIDVRRRFNAALAWWLWEKQGTSASTLGQIPQELVEQSVSGISHDYDKEELKRELVQGCLLEKGADTVFFAHRSMHEFLVAEYLFTSDLASDASNLSNSLCHSLSLLTPETIDFLLGIFENAPDGPTKARRWLDLLGGATGEISTQAFVLFVKLSQRFDIAVDKKFASPWHVYLYYLQACSIDTLSAPTRLAPQIIGEVFRASRGLSIEIQAAAVYLLAAAFHAASSERNWPMMLIEMLDWNAFAAKTGEASGARSTRRQVEQEPDYLLWSFLRMIKFNDDASEGPQIAFAFEEIAKDALIRTQCKLTSYVEPGLYYRPVRYFLSEIGRVYSAANRQSVRSFFSSQKVRNAMPPVEVIRSRSAFVGGYPARPAREKLSLPNKVKGKP